MSWQTRERHGLSPRLRKDESDRAWAHSQTAADEREAQVKQVKHIAQGLYRMKLAFSDAKALEITTWWVSHIQGLFAMLFAT